MTRGTSASPDVPRRHIRYHLRVLVTAENDVAGATIAAEKVVETHRRLVEFLHAGQTLAEVDAFVGHTLADLDSISAFKHYRVRGHPPFPSEACLSVNECVVHGTHDMTSTPIAPGDLLSIDIGVKHDGWIGDAAWTYVIEATDEVSMSLVIAGRESLRLGVEAMQPGRPLVDWARVVQDHVEKKCGFGLVRGLGGHGYGRTLHGPPFISNVVPTFPGEWPDAFRNFRPGMLIAVEPMLAVSTTEIRSEGREWPIYSADGSRSVHHEADVLITEDGPVNLTASLFDLPDVVGN
jgi:methionyl aminopeptidase